MVLKNIYPWFLTSNRKLITRCILFETCQPPKFFNLVNYQIQFCHCFHKQRSKSSKRQCFRKLKTSDSNFTHLASQHLTYCFKNSFIILLILKSKYSRIQEHILTAFFKLYACSSLTIKRKYIN